MKKLTTQKQRDGFTFYRSFRDSIGMTDEADQLMLYKAIADYALDGIEPDISTLGALGRLCWTAICPNIKSGVTNFRNGCNGGAPKGNKNAKKQPKNNPNSTEKQPAKTSNENENENENENIDKKHTNVCKESADKPHKDASKRTAFVAPSLEELRVFISEQGLKNVNPEEFIDHYTANGWRAGRNPMKDWKAAARNWNRRSPEFNNPKNSIQNENKLQLELLR